jgi:hypothetical protein
MELKNSLFVSGGFFFLFMFIFSYFFIYPTFVESLKFTVISTLIFLPLNFILNKTFNKKKLK